MKRIYETNIKPISLKISDKLSEMSNMLNIEIKKLLIKYAAQIIIMEYDYRTLLGKSPEEALAAALGVNEPKEIMKNYSFHYNNNKPAGISKFINDSIKRKPIVFDECDAEKEKKSDFRYLLSLSVCNNKVYVTLECFRYDICAAFEELVNKYWNGHILENDDLNLKKVNSISGDCILYVTYDILLNADVREFTNKKYRACMLMLEDEFINKAKKIPGWKETDAIADFNDWFNVREALAATLFDDISWDALIMEEIKEQREPEKRHRKNIFAPLKTVKIFKRKGK